MCIQKDIITFCILGFTGLDELFKPASAHELPIDIKNQTTSCASSPVETVTINSLVSPSAPARNHRGISASKSTDSTPWQNQSGHNYPPSHAAPVKSKRHLIFSHRCSASFINGSSIRACVNR